jgi:thiamine pyrophosphate-dependent acetolactate synthase large subunit-like protein
MDVTVYNQRIMGKAHVENSVDLAIRAAMGYKGVAHLTIPADIQEMHSDERSKRNKPNHTSDVPVRRGLVADQAGLQKAAEILNGAKKPVIMAGQGALDATDELEQAAELLGGPIVKPLLGKACVPDTSPYTTGGIGLVGTAPSQAAIEECDALLIVGTSFHTSSSCPNRARPAAFRSRSTRCESGSATRSRLAWSETARQPSRPCYRCCSAMRIGRSCSRRRSAWPTGES